jgi:lysophospholipase L1-like esterase
MAGSMRVFRDVFLALCFSCVLVLTFTPAVVALAKAVLSLSPSFVGPKTYYLALGDSLAYGFQPNLDWNHGYVDDFFANLESHGTTSVVNMACPGETSSTFIHGGCPGQTIDKYLYFGPQLAAAVSFLRSHAGMVSPVTLDIGVNDVLPDINGSTCTENARQFASDLKALDANLTGTILPQLKAALTVKGKVTGDLLVMNYYDAFQNACPNTVSYAEKMNQHLAADVAGFGVMVDVFGAFGGAKVPNTNICAYTWMCSVLKDVHPMREGYSVIAGAFEKAYGF